MAGNFSEKRAHADAKRAAHMQAEGLTTRQIAEAVGLDPKQVKARILLGQRLIAEEQQVVKDAPFQY
jgi:prolyl-tRNA editing enzyme YbaK/EbsC (Cys-tRNA(Pro) deacylase)